MRCPECNLINPDSASKCDCGYSFLTNEPAVNEPPVMSQARLDYYTKIAFALAPLLIAVSLVWNPPKIYKTVDLNSILVLLYGIYALVVCAFRLAGTFREWRDEQSSWRRSFRRVYVVAFILALLMILIIVSGSNEYSFMGLWIFFPLAFLFVFGLIAMIYGFMALPYRRNRPKLYLWVSLVSGFGFFIVGIIPVIIVFFWFFSGPEALMPPCYCPVNRKARFRDHWLAPLYQQRKEQLKKRLCSDERSI